MTSRIFKVWRRVRANGRVIGFWRALWLDLAVIYNFRCHLLRLPALSGLQWFSVDGIEHAIAIRVGTSDSTIFQQIFTEQEYGPLAALPGPSLILDCGANVGYSAIWFLNRFPSARVIAVEPDLENFRMCQANLAPYGDRVLLLHSALWSSPAGLVQVQARLTMEAAHVVRQAGPGEAPDIKAVDIPTLIEISGARQVDLLKLDIEGAESEVFRTGTERWLQHVRNISVELHGSESDSAFSAAMRPFDFDFAKSGELTLCLNIKAKTRS